jgi:hypothetical protein
MEGACLVVGVDVAGRIKGVRGEEVCKIGSAGIST